MTVARYALAAAVGVAAAVVGTLALALEEDEHAAARDAAHALGHQALIGIASAILAGLVLAGGEKRRIAPLALAAAFAWLASALALARLTP